ncbi:MAG: LysE family translocator [Motiliproteus sp.]|nr:LysE family translocator [Motiliproteus sp.]
MSPGQDMVLVMSRGMSQGAKAGTVTAAGVSVGLLGHTLLAAFGLGALLQASELAFSLMKWIGAAYLIYLGFRLFKAAPVKLDQAVGDQKSLRKAFIQGSISNLSNPKVAIFYFSYLPQFVSPDSKHATETLLMLGCAFAMTTFLVKMPIGYLAGACSGWVQSRTWVQNWINRTSGSVLIVLGIGLATDSQPEGF